MRPGGPASVSVTRVMWAYNIDVNSALGKNSKEPSSSTILTEPSFNGNSKEEAHNANKTWWQ